MVSKKQFETTKVFVTAWLQKNQNQQPELVEEPEILQKYP